MKKTNLENYLEKVLDSEDGMINRDKFIQENELDKEHILNRFKISTWLFTAMLLLIPFGIYFTETNNKYGLTVILIVAFALFSASVIAMAINGTIEDLERKWLAKEWKENTGLDYKVNIYPNQGFSTISIGSISNFCFLAEETDFMSRISNMNEKKQVKMLKRALAIEEF